MSIKLIKQLIKYNIQLIALAFGRHRQTHKTPQLVILMYHRILPADDNRCLTEEPGMIVTPSTFKQHMKILAEYFQFVSLNDWINKKNNNQPLPAMACAITFDDGWSDNYEFAYPILKELNVPATIYLVSNIVDTDNIFWPERVSHAIINIANNHSTLWNKPELKWLKNTQTDYTFNEKSPTREQISQIIKSLKEYTDTDINQRLNALESDFNIESYSSTSQNILTWQQIDEMIDSGLVEAGSHTCQHIRLVDDLSSDLLNDEVVKSKKIIEKKINAQINTFCFPNGDFSNASSKLVKKHYLSSVSTQPGWNSSTSSSHLLKRVAVHEDISNTKAAFLSRLSGWT